MDAVGLIQAGLLACAAWGLLRFISQVDRLEQRVNECCGHDRHRTEKTKLRTVRRR